MPRVGKRLLALRKITCGTRNATFITKMLSPAVALRSPHLPKIVDYMKSVDYIKRKSGLKPLFEFRRLKIVEIKVVA